MIEIEQNKEILKNNRIKSITTFSIPAQETNKKYIGRKTQFDKNGNKIELIEYEEGFITRFQKWEFDNKNRLKLKRWYNCYGRKKEDFIYSDTIYEYGHNGLEILPHKYVEEIDLNDKVIITSFYKNGKIRSRRTMNKEGIPTEYLEFKSEKVVQKTKFNIRGHILSVKNFDIRGNPLHYIEYTRDLNGNPTKIKKVSKNGYVKQNRILEYNKIGLLIEDIDLVDGFYKLPKSGNLTLQGSSKETQKHSYRHVLSYDDRKLILSHKMFIYDRHLLNYKYEYEFYKD